MGAVPGSRPAGVTPKGGGLTQLLFVRPTIRKTSSWKRLVNRGVASWVWGAGFVSRNSSKSGMSTSWQEGQSLSSHPLPPKPSLPPSPSSCSIRQQGEACSKTTGGHRHQPISTPRGTRSAGRLARIRSRTCVRADIWMGLIGHTWYEGQGCQFENTALGPAASCMQGLGAGKNPRGDGLRGVSEPLTMPPWTPRPRFW